MTRKPLTRELRRLSDRLSFHRRRALNRNLPAEHIPVDVFLAQADDGKGNYICACGTVMSLAPEMENNKLTVGHKFPLSALEKEPGTHPGHTLENTIPECWGCNQSQNHEQDTVFIAQGKRMAVNKTLPTPEERRERKAGKTRKIQSQGFQGHRNFKGERIWK